MLLAKKLAAWLAAALFAAATVGALLQPVHPDPFAPRIGLDRFLYPTETNAFTRLPSVSADLNDLHVEVDDGGVAKLWAVGDGGAILHSPDGGRCWEAQGPWAPNGSGNVCGPRNLWDQMELIPGASAAEKAPPKEGSSAKNAQVKGGRSVADRLSPGGLDSQVPGLRDELRAAGYDTGDLPENPRLFDEGLARAVMAFQRASGIVADGIIGAQTRSLLDDLAARQKVEQTAGDPETQVDAGVIELPPERPPEAPTATPPPDLQALHFIDAETGWAVGGEGTILKTVDGGVRWTEQASGTPKSLTAVQFQGAEIGWAVGGEGTILKTVDGGARWTEQTSGTKAWLTAVHFRGAETGWAVGGEGTILKTVDGGATWKSPLASYAIGPAPWYWGACLLTVALLGFSAWPQRPRVTERSVADLLASDRPLRDRAEADALDLGVIAGSLSEFLRNRNTEAPLTVAVTGDWGSGKTSLMNLLRQDLADNNFRPVWFNAWHHQKGEQILASLFAHIREQSIPPLLSWRGLRFRWRLLVRRGAPVWLLFTVLLVVLAASVGFLGDLIAQYSVYAWEVARDPELIWHKDWRPVTKLFTALAGIGASAFGLIRTMQGFGLNPQKLVTVNPQNRKAQGLDPGARSRFAREFRDVTECLKPRKMVIFIDDLDRCGQHSLIEVLEAVNFLASSGDCFIVMGMSTSWVEACVGLEYEHLAQAMADEFPTDNNGGEQSVRHRQDFARNYLEKLINIEVPIPGLDQERAGVLIAPEVETGPDQEKRSWQRRLLDALGPLSGAWKPVLLALAVGYGVWFGLDLLHKPPKTSPPAKEVHWSTGEVVLSLADVQRGREEQDKAAGVQQMPLPAPKRQLSELGVTPKPAGGALVRTLSELLGVEISIRADPKDLEKGLVLHEQGKDGSGWQIVLSEPKEPAAESLQPEDEPKEKNEPPPKKDDQPETRPFELTPGSQPKAAVPAWAFAVAAILLLTFAWRSSRRSALEITADSRDFQDALKIWLPWLMAKQGTPRAVKRFVNWLRYIATRLRKAAGSEEDRFPEPNTVALAAIHFFESEWLTNGFQYQMVIGSNFESLLKSGEGVAARMDDEQVKALAGSLSGCVEKFANWVGEEGLSEKERQRRGTWIPSEEHRKAFLAVISEKPVVG